MPVDADEALRRATLIRSDPSLRGVTRQNVATEEGEVKWQYLAPDGEPAVSYTHLTLPTSDLV